MIENLVWQIQGGPARHAQRSSAVKFRRGFADKHRSSEKSPRRSSEEHSFTQSEIANGVKVGNGGLANKHRSG